MPVDPFRLVRVPAPAPHVSPFGNTRREPLEHSAGTESSFLSGNDTISYDETGAQFRRTPSQYFSQRPFSHYRSFGDAAAPGSSAPIPLEDNSGDFNLGYANSAGYPLGGSLGKQAGGAPLIRDDPAASPHASEDPSRTRQTAESLAESFFPGPSRPEAAIRREGPGRAYYREDLFGNLFSLDELFPEMYFPPIEPDKVLNDHASSSHAGDAGLAAPSSEQAVQDTHVRSKIFASRRVLPEWIANIRKEILDEPVPADKFVPPLDHSEIPETRLNQVQRLLLLSKFDLSRVKKQKFSARALGPYIGKGVPYLNELEPEKATISADAVQRYAEKWVASPNEDHGVHKSIKHNSSLLPNASRQHDRLQRRRTNLRLEKSLKMLSPHPELAGAKGVMDAIVMRTRAHAKAKRARLNGTNIIRTVLPKITSELAASSATTIPLKAIEEYYLAAVSPLMRDPA